MWMDSFCYPVSSFLKKAKLDNGSWHDEVDVTECFEDTAMLYTIGVCFWVFVFLRRICSGNTRYNRANVVVPSNLNLFKKLICIAIVLPAVADLVYTIYQSTQERVAHYQFLTPVVLAITMFFAIYSMIFERKIGVHSSGVMTVLWLVLTLYGGIKLRTLILKMQDSENRIEDVFRFTTFCTELFLTALQFLLVFIPEPILPIEDHTEREPCPEESASFLSRITWWWQNRLFWLGFKKTLVHSDLCDLNCTNKSHNIAEKFHKNWEKQFRKYKVYRNDVTSEGVSIKHDGCWNRCTVKRPSLFTALVYTVGFDYAIGLVLRLFGQDMLTFVSPQILRLMIGYVNDPSQPEWRGYFYAIALFVAVTLRSIISHQHYHRNNLTGMRVRAAAMAVVYRKALRLSNRAHCRYSAGEIVNLMSVDAQRLMDTMISVHLLFSAPLQIILALVFLHHTLGPSIYAGVVIMVLLTPLNIAFAGIDKINQEKQMTQKDYRLRLMSELLNGIKVIKLYAWEIPFKKMVMVFRGNELSALKASAYINALSSTVYRSTSFLVAMATFTTYSLIHRNDPNPENRFTADKAFVALSLFSIMRFPLSIFPVTISSLIQATISLKRISTFLQEDELDQESIDTTCDAADDGENAVIVDNASFTWEENDKPCLKKWADFIDLTVKPGELVAVVGQVGAGKSSLVSALLGEMEKMNGYVAMRGSVAYVPQQAWIQNATLKDNILFDKPMNGRLYDQTLHACALEPDLEILAAGDMTEIGEKGINLSGGQKQRVSLARSVYQEADIYLLDDPLSAVDSHVGKHIFDKVIGPDGMLSRKVRILVTHGLGFLPQCDKIIVMVEGKITEVGTYEELLEQDQAFAEYLRNYDQTNPSAKSPGTQDCTKATNNVKKCTSHFGLESTEIEESGFERSLTKSKDYGTISGSSNSICVSTTELESNEKSALINKEIVKSGQIRFSVFLTYARACTFHMCLLILLFGFLSCGSDVGQSFWLVHWSNGISNTSNIGVDLGVYASLGALRSLFILLLFCLLGQASIYGSRMLHDNMLTAIFRSPMSFFDTTPLGRILNRFSMDMYTIDEEIPIAVNVFLTQFFYILSTILVIAIASPWFMVALVPLAIFYGFIQRFYVSTSRQLKRLESVSRSPIYSHFQESVTGASSIRAYEQTDRFIEMADSKVDDNNIAYYPIVCGYRWIAIRLDFMGNLIIFAAALFASLQRNYPDLFGRINPGLAGLSITYALQITSALTWMVRMSSDLESNVVAVERAKEYSEIEPEAPDITNNRPPLDWPSKGRVKFDSYSTRYRQSSSLVLKGITADILSAQKVGIVGRTGAGKSSLTLALFRIIESVRGAILIDGIDIATIGLRDLRSRITIIPQDPVLFSGTLRVNLDPFDSHTDDDIWVALQTAHLSEFVGGLEAGLQHEIAEGGENISVGQRQLVCLARALLRKTKILVLDEATAAVDMETDDFIQKTIRREFADATVITIAHRLNTIMDYDKVIVLENGRTVEFDSPRKLLESKGTFYGMARDANLL